MEWTLDKKLMDQLSLHEGCKLKPYRCTAGKLTIGVGRNLDDVGITASEAQMMLRNDIARCEVDLDRNLEWWRTMSPNRQRVLIDMTFNLGITKLLTFKNTLSFMRKGMYESASEGMLSSLWAKQVGVRAERLAKMMREG